MRKNFVLLIVSFLLCMPEVASSKKKNDVPNSEITEVVDASNSQLKFNILTESTAEVINDDSYWSLISATIPAKIKIGDYVFTVTRIGSKAFEKCQNLTSIEIPSSVTSIGNEAFSDCSSLTKIKIPSSVTSIGEGAFFDCKNLTDIELPSSITRIEYGLFEGCKELE